VVVLPEARGPDLRQFALQLVVDVVVGSDCALEVLEVLGLVIALDDFDHV